MIPWVKKKPLLFVGRYRYTRILHKRTTSDTVSNCRPSTWPWNWCELVDPDATAWLSTKVWNGLQVSVLLPSACRFLPNTFSWANYAHSIPVIAGHQWDTSSKWQPLSLSCKVVFMRGSLGLSNGGGRDEEDVFYTKGWNRLPSVTLFSDFRYSNGHAMVTLRIWPGKLTCCHQDCGRRNTRSRAPAAPLSRCKNDKNVSFGHLWIFEHVRTVLQRFRAIQYDLIWLNDSIYLDVWRSLAGLAHHFQPGAASWWSGRLLPDMNRHNGTAAAHFFKRPSTAHFFEWSLKSLRPNLLYHCLRQFPTPSARIRGRTRRWFSGALAGWLPSFASWLWISFDYWAFRAFVSACICIYLCPSCAARSTLRLWTLRWILRGASLAAEWLLRPCARKTVIGPIGIAAGKATPHLKSTRLQEFAWLYTHIQEIR